jgi:hypothetical protein
MKPYTTALTLLAAVVVQNVALSTSVRADPIEPLPQLLVRALTTKWPTATARPPDRIERNEAGQIVTLRLEGVKLVADDIEQIRSFRQLARLGLSYTNVSDSDLDSLAALPQLEGITLNYTEIGDDGVAALARFPKLKAACLARVRASPAAVRALKDERPKLSIGYSQR